jgi:hypothetical protein
MSLNSGTFQTGRLKHVFLRTGGSPQPGEYVPRLYLEAKVDFADVRSGLRATCSVSRALEIYRMEVDSLWTDDMAWDVEPDRVATEFPAGVRLRELPAAVDADFLASVERNCLAYLLRSFHVRLFRNFALNIYSRLDESLPDFQARCLEMLREPFRKDVDSLRDVFGRSMEQLRQKYVSPNTWTTDDRGRLAARHRSEFRDVAERLSSIFMNVDLTVLCPFEAMPKGAGSTDLQERLASTAQDARSSIERLLTSYRERARNVDEYIIRPNLRDIHLVRTCLLWMPEVVN